MPIGQITGPCYLCQPATAAPTAPTPWYWHHMRRTKRLLVRSETPSYVTTTESVTSRTSFHLKINTKDESHGDVLKALQTQSVKSCRHKIFKTFSSKTLLLQIQKMKRVRGYWSPQLRLFWWELLLMWVADDLLCWSGSNGFTCSSSLPNPVCTQQVW